MKSGPEVVFMFQARLGGVSFSCQVRKRDAGPRLRKANDFHVSLRLSGSRCQKLDAKSIVLGGVHL